MFDYKKGLSLTSALLCVSFLNFSLAQYKEEPIPESLLQPRDYNPHPYQLPLSQFNDNSLQNINFPPFNQEAPVTESANGVFR